MNITYEFLKDGMPWIVQSEQVHPCEGLTLEECARAHVAERSDLFR